LKYYFTDVGLRNARLNFRQQEDDIIPWHDEKGVCYVGIEQFLLDETAMDL
jgi:hypothetical protein